MSGFSKILWGEGLFLRPQHFQLQDAYHDARRAEAMRLLHPYAWGVQALQFDNDALTAGMLMLSDVQLVFPDGESFSAPGNDTLPESINLANNPELPDSFLVYLTMAPLRPDGSNVGRDGEGSGKQMRFVQAEHTVSDLFTDAVPADVLTLRRQTRLMTEMQSREGLLSIPIVRLRKSATSGYEIDRGFIPPATSISASPVLKLVLKRLLDILQAKVNSLYGHHREGGKNLLEFRSGDIASFWLLHTASTAYAGLLHLYQHPQLHPERLFQQLLQLAGGLLTFSKDYSLSDLPVYSHQDPAKAFVQIDTIIRELLDTVISARYVSIPLLENKPGFWSGRLDSEKINSGSRFYLSVSAALPAAEVVDNVPLRFKAGSPDDVEKLVLSAMPGVTFVHAPQVPSAIPVRAGSFYFELEARGVIFERMIQSQSIVMYVPSVFPDLKIELLAVIS